MTATLVDVATHRWTTLRWFVWIGFACIIAGGLVAAVTRPTEFGSGAWLAAYLVLVAGVAQIALGTGQAVLARDGPRHSVVRVEVVAWNGGAAATILGTLAGAPVVTTVGAAATAIALGCFIMSVRAAGGSLRWANVLYRVTAAIVLFSIPIGVVLSWTRHG